MLGIMFASKRQSIDKETPTPTPIVLYKPVFAIHIILYRTLLPQLSHISPWERSAILSGRRFTALVDSIVADTLPIGLERLRLQNLAPALKRRLEYLATLPELRVTPPDDGDREPEPGEKGGRRARRVRGLLAPPKRKSKPGKEKKNKDRVLGCQVAKK